MNPFSGPKERVRTLAPWWGPHTILPETQRFWQIGPLRLWVAHKSNQWQLTWSDSNDWLTPEVISESHPDVTVTSKWKQINCAYRNIREEIGFSPALPDRNLITKLKVPLRILPGEDVQVFICAPLWLKIETNAPSRLIHELPVFRLSDTWFGPASSVGELAYACQAPLYLTASEVPLREHCVTTSLIIRNLGSDSLDIERLNVPMPRLSLYYSARTGFWTNILILERREGPDHASLRFEAEPPKENGPFKFLSPPRLTAGGEGVVVRAFSGLFR